MVEEELAKAENLKSIIFSKPSKKDSVLKEILSFEHDSIISNVLLDISYHFYLENDSLNFRL